MFNRTEIKSCFTELIGWRDSAKAPDCYPNLSASLTTSDSGIYVNDIPAMNLKVINEMIGVDEADVDTYLTNIHESCAIDLVNQFVILQKEKLRTKALLENFSIGTRIGNIRDLDITRSRFVGFEIRPSKSNNIQVQINAIGVQFSEIEDLNIYFYSSSQVEPLQTFNLINTKQLSLEWFTLSNFVAEYMATDKGSGDTYYLGYYEDDMIGQPVETQMPCGTCASSPLTKIRPYLSIRPIEVAGDKTYLDRGLFDVESVGFTDRTFGLHLKVNAMCDVTNVICQNKLMLSSAYQKKVAITLFWEAYNSDKINRSTLINKEDSRLMAEKLEMDLKEELETISIDFSQIDGVCLPCKRKSLGVMPLG